MGLELKVEQKQRVYQKQIEQARILQMNAQELAVCIQEAALENPLIELEEMMGGNWGKRKGNCGKVGGSVGQQRISGDSGEKTGKIYTMFGAGTSECIRDT